MLVDVREKHGPVFKAGKDGVLARYSLHTGRQLIVFLSDAYSGSLHWPEFTVKRPTDRSVCARSCQKGSFANPGETLYFCRVA